MLKLKILREKTTKSKQDVADFLGVSRPTYTRYENGEREPDYKTLSNLAQYFDVSVDYLLGLTDQKKPVANDEQKLSTNEKLILKLYDSLDEKSKAKAEGFLAALADQDKS